MSLPDIKHTLQSVAVSTTFTTDYVPEGTKIYGHPNPTMTGDIVFEYSSPTASHPGRITVNGTCHYTDEAQKAIRTHSKESRDGLKRALCFAVYSRAQCGTCLECNNCGRLTGTEGNVKANAHGSRYRLSGARIWTAINTGPDLDPERTSCLRMLDITPTPT